MMPKAQFFSHKLVFKNPSGTSRGILTEKETYIISLDVEGKTAFGECNFFKGLSCDNENDYQKTLHWLCQNIFLPKEDILNELQAFPSLIFGYEQVLANYYNLQKNNDIYFQSEFTDKQKGIKTNGLIWMGTIDFMQQQIDEKLAQNYDCIKLKIGVNWEEEYQLLQKLRNTYPNDRLEIRVDANGGFTFEQAKLVLGQLANLHIHSIEQPIQQGNWEQIALLCEQTPTPIALDEELIGIIDNITKTQLLYHIKPQYIILKPTLIGGFSGSEEWISIAENNNIKWWITSALESNIGLNALAQWTFTLGNSLPQGLGTGNLFTGNFPSKTYMKGDELWYS